MESKKVSYPQNALIMLEFVIMLLNIIINKITKDLMMMRRNVDI